MQIVWIAIWFVIQQSYGLGVEAVKKPFGPTIGVPQCKVLKYYLSCFLYFKSLSFKSFTFTSLHS